MPIHDASAVPLLAFVLSLPWWIPETCRAAEDDRPNLVVILCDDMGFCDLGCFGGEIETRDLSEQHPVVVERLGAMYDDWTKRIGAKGHTRCMKTKPSFQVPTV